MGSQDIAAEYDSDGVAVKAFMELDMVSMPFDPLCSAMD